MKKSYFVLIPIILINLIYTQSVDVKDSGDQLLLQVNDEGDGKSSVTIPNSNSAPTSTNNKLYNEGGTLKWNGSSLGTLAGADGDWTISGDNLYSAVSGNIGIGSTNPTAKLHVSGDDGLLVIGGAWDAGTVQNLGQGARLHFYSKKWAIRAGYALSDEWDDANIGSNSVAMGYRTKASGSRSVSMGNLTTASGEESTAFGKYSIASGKISTALGSSNAESYVSTAVGRYNIGGGDPDLWIETDPLFEIGIGLYNNSRANAFTVLKNGNIGIGTVNPLSQLSVGSEGLSSTAVYGKIIGGNAVYGDAFGPSSYGVFGQSSGGHGIYGYAYNSSGENFGVRGKTESSVGWAGYFEGRGYFNSNVGIGTTNPLSKLSVGGDGFGYVGIYGKYSGTGTAVYGDATGGTGYGIFGRASGGTGYGVYGYATDGTGNNYGIFGKTESANGWAGYFEGRGYFSDKVGIGTASPRSKLQVSGGYIQVPTRSGSDPPASDCNEVSEAGRIVVRTDGSTNCYICTGTGGWVGL